MDTNMDIDLVLDEDDPDMALITQQARALEQQNLEMETQFNADAMDDVDAGPEEGELDSNSVIPEKIHIRGLDDLTTADIVAYVKEYYSAPELFKKVEWIDDTSANLIFATAEAAKDAFHYLSEGIPEDELALRPAMTMPSHPDVRLEIRMAMAADIKLPGAMHRSKFYLNHPEHDPDQRAMNRKRRYENERAGGHKRRREDTDRYTRRGSQEQPAFSADFYDDSTGLDVDVVESKRTQIQDLFKNRKINEPVQKAARTDGRLRDRSASPTRDGDGRYGFDEEQPYRRTARRRSPTPPHLQRARRREYHDEDSNRSKELFPDFNAAHKRSDAQDLRHDQVADLRAVKKPAPKGDLFSRITMPGQDNGRRDRLVESGQNDNNGGEGYLFLGAAKKMKELFPDKAGAKNGGKDLFDGRIKGKATQRRRAEDMF